MKKTLALTLLVMLLISAVAGIEFVRNAYANPALMPPEPPSGYRIYSDGTYTAQNLSRNGNTYTFTDDIKGTIVVQRDGIVLDGAGHTLIGNGDSSGIWLQNQSNVVIKNLNIRNFRIGIFCKRKESLSLISNDLHYNVNCGILSNTITNNTYGISIAASSKCYVEGNYIADNTYGASLHGSDVFRNNRFKGNQYSILDEGYGDNDMDTSNTINGKPIYYWINQHDMTVPSDAGLVVLKNCSGIKVKNLSLEGNANGLLLLNTNNSTIAENLLSNNINGIVLNKSYNNVLSGNHIADNNYKGIILDQSSNNSVLNNKITENGGERADSKGFYLSSSNDNIISNNEITNNEQDGIYFYQSNDCTVTNNYVPGNMGDGIFFNNISGSSVLGNTVTLNKGYGIGLEYGPNATIKGNYISKNNVGIWIGTAFYNNIISNTVIENNGLGIQLEGPHHDNLIYHNNFIDNNKGGTQASIAQIWTYPDLDKLFSKDPPPRPPQLVGGTANTWDDGTEGNYWSDYTTRYPAAQKAENSTAGNTPYYINENTQDNHPLMAPHEISTLEMLSITVLPAPSTQPTQETNPTPTQTIETKPATFPTTLAIACIASVAIVGISLLFYFKKHRS